MMNKAENMNNYKLNKEMKETYRQIEKKTHKNRIRTY